MASISATYNAPLEPETHKWKEIKQGFTHVADGDVAMAKITPCFQNGKVAVMKRLTNGIGAGTTELHVLRPYAACLLPEYAAIYLRSPQFVEEGVARMTGSAGQQRVPKDYFASNPFPLPPLAEQRRIVGKVDQLLGLCDELASRQESRRAARERLVVATLDRLTSPDRTSRHRACPGGSTASALLADTRNLSSAKAAKPLGQTQGREDDAQRLQDHFDLLFDTPTTIPHLRQAILQLAVQGQLVPQDPNDEPAESLLAEIATFKKQSTGQANTISSLELDAAGFPLPRGWRVANFGDLMLNRDGERIPVSREIRDGREGPYDYYGASGVIDSIDDFLFDKPLLLIGEDGANLVNRSTPIAFIAQGKYWVNNHAHVLDGISLDFLRYIELFINAIDLKPYVTGTAQPKMNQAKMNSIPIALPPLAEQKRIVAKVTELLSLCDALETQLQSAESASTQLLSATVSHLLNTDSREGAKPRREQPA